MKDDIEWLIGYTRHADISTTHKKQKKLRNKKCKTDTENEYIRRCVLNFIVTCRYS